MPHVHVWLHAASFRMMPIPLYAGAQAKQCRRLLHRIFRDLESEWLAKRPLICAALDLLGQQAVTGRVVVAYMFGGRVGRLAEWRSVLCGGTHAPCVDVNSVVRNDVELLRLQRFVGLDSGRVWASSRSRTGEAAVRRSERPGNNRLTRQQGGLTFAEICG